MKIKIIHNVPTWLPQTQTWLFNQALHLSKTDFESHIVCESTENLDQFPIPNIHNLEETFWLYRYWNLFLRRFHFRNHLGFLTKVANATNAQIIHSHFGNIGWASLGAITKSRTKHVVTFYGLDVNMLPTQDHRWFSRYKRLFQQADLFLCEGSHMASCLIKLGCPPSKVKVHHLGIEVNNIKYKPRKWKHGDTLNVLIAASFREKKGIPYALEALGYIKNEINLNITIIGDANNTPSSQKELENINHIIEKYELKTKIKFLGFQPYSVLMSEAYNNHIFLSPSVTAENGDTEGGAPVTLIEMMATGMPIVSTQHCDIPEVVNYNNKDNLLAKERDSLDVANKIRWLLDNPQSWKELCDVGRKHVEVNYNAVTQGVRLGDLYKSTIN